MCLSHRALMLIMPIRLEFQSVVLKSIFFWQILQIKRYQSYMTGTKLTAIFKTFFLSHFLLLFTKVQNPIAEI